MKNEVSFGHLKIGLINRTPWIPTKIVNMVQIINPGPSGLKFIESLVNIGVIVPTVSPFTAQFCLFLNLEEKGTSWWAPVALMLWSCTSRSHTNIMQITHTIQSTTVKYFALVGLANMSVQFLFQQPLHYSLLPSPKGHNTPFQGYPWATSTALPWHTIWR